MKRNYKGRQYLRTLSRDVIARCYSPNCKFTAADDEAAAGMLRTMAKLAGEAHPNVLEMTGKVVKNYRSEIGLVAFKQTGKRGKNSGAIVGGNVSQSGHGFSVNIDTGKDIKRYVIPAGFYADNENTAPLRSNGESESESEIPMLRAIDNDKPLDRFMDNLLAYRLGYIVQETIRLRAENTGDLIDLGLRLRRLLAEGGFELRRASGRASDSQPGVSTGQPDDGSQGL